MSRPDRRRRSGRSTAARRRAAAHGYSILELVFATVTIATLSAVSVPTLLATLDDYRAAGAARYISARLQRARMDAVTRSADVGLVVSETAGGYSYAVYVDRNRNGVRTTDIQNGVDKPLAASERLMDQFSGVDFGALPGLPPVDAGGTPPGSDPIRLGSSDIASFTAAGTSSSGSVYIRGRGGAQYVVRVYGQTGKTRVLKFNRRTGKWNPL
jgi:type II secretory pathway pseudopilin PulG